MKRLPGLFPRIDRYPLSYRTLGYVLLCSSTLALMATAVQLYVEYRRDVAHLYANIDLIEKSYLASISSSVYKIDSEALQLQLDGALKLTDIVRLEVKEQRGNDIIVTSSGNFTTRNLIHRDFALTYPDPAIQMRKIGTLTVTASMDGIYHRLLSRVFTVLATNTVKTFLASSGILVIIYWLITRHLTQISDYTRMLRPGKQDSRLTLQRKPSSPSKEDELDRVVLSFNMLQDRLNEDIARRDAYEKRLRNAEAKYRTVAEFTYDWEYWANLDDSLEYVSPSCQRISGYTPRDFIENPSLLKDIIVPEDREIWDRHFHDARQEQKLRETQFRIQRRDGEIRWIEHNCQPVTDPQGRLLGFRASNRDITVRKRIEKGIQEREKDLRKLATRLISAHEEERRGLARELHDDLSQRLAALAIQAGRLEQQALNQLVSDAEEYGGLRDRIIAISNDVHSLSRQLHPSILDDLGLTKAVESQCIRFSKQEGIEVTFTAENIPQTISRDVSLSIYRIIQEGLNNIAKHACARQAEVVLQRTDGRLSLSIQDDGIGFDAAEVRQKAGLGLSSMRERVRIIHGVLRITSEPEKGTLITVRVPLVNSRREEATPIDPE